jgi:RNA polymerase sigma factor (sigma-70 family)
LEGSLFLGGCYFGWGLGTLVVLSYLAVPDQDFEELFGGANAYEKLCRALTAYLVRRAPDYPIEDMVQETLLRAIPAIRQGRNIPDVTRFCYGIAFNVMQEFIRGLRTHSMEELISDPRDPVQTDQIKRIYLQELLRNCTVEERILFRRYYEDDRAELATELGLTTNALRGRVFQIRRRLREAATQKKK